MQYSKGKYYLWMILRADNANIIKWYIDSDHAVQNDVRKHSREILQILKGSIISKSIKQKLNTKISTESELDCIDDGIKK